MESIKIENLSFKYPLADSFALNNISIIINSGEFVTVCGKSGCGKSTLLRHIKPVLAPHGEMKGSVLIGGMNAFLMTEKAQVEDIGYVFQNPDSQLVTDKVWHELAFGLESLSYPADEIRRRVAEIASFFGIGEWFSRDVSELSGGQKQLLNLASVMVMRPRVLLLDEPTSQLDPIAAETFLGMVKKINRELGVTVVLTEHRLEEIFGITDKVGVMENGRLFAYGTPTEVARELYSTNNEIFMALPTPMRVYFSKAYDGTSPVTVRDGRGWLLKQNIEKTVEKEEKYPATDEVLRLKDIWFRYEKNLPDILKGLSLSLNRGELYAVVGGNGSGKTTMLSVASGVMKQYRGKVKTDKKIALLPQDPRSLFVKKTVELDLFDVLDGAEMNEDEKKKVVADVVDFCELDGLLARHPFDLSGGEEQRVALAKILLAKPDILLIDVPTKGLDAHFKIKLAGLLGELKKQGMAILMVSHDIEFAARYSDRVGMFFDGVIISEATPRQFFLSNSLYTTSAVRMARGIVDGAVTAEDIIYVIGGNATKEKRNG